MLNSLVVSGNCSLVLLDFIVLCLDPDNEANTVEQLLRVSNNRPRSRQRPTYAVLSVNSTLY